MVRHIFMKILKFMKKICNTWRESGSEGVIKLKWYTSLQAVTGGVGGSNEGGGRGEGREGAKEGVVKMTKCDVNYERNLILNKKQ